MMSLDKVKITDVTKTASFTLFNGVWNLPYFIDRGDKCETLGDTQSSKLVYCTLPLFFKQGDPFRKFFNIYIYMLLVNKCEIEILLFKYEDDYSYHPDHMVKINFPLQVTCNLVLEILHVLILQWCYIPLIYHSLQN